MPRHRSTSYATTSTRRGPGRRMFMGTPRIIRAKTMTYSLPSALSRGGKLRSGKASEELKFYDLAEAFALTTTLSSMTTAPKTLNTIPQGNTQSQRIGNRARIKSVMVQGYFTVIGADGAAGVHDEFDNMARIMICVDHQSNGALPPAADILKSATSINSFRELDASDRFTVLFDHKQTIVAPTHFEGTDGITAGIDRKYQFSFYKKGLDLLVQFDGSGEDVGNTVNNSIVIFGMIEDTLCAVTAFFNTRVRYTG